MTLNKAQGKTFSRGLLLLTRDVFAHGQLYVGLTRFGAASDVAVLVSPERRIDGRAVVLNVVSSSLVQPVYQEFASLRPGISACTVSNTTWQRLNAITVFITYDLNIQGGSKSKDVVSIVRIFKTLMIVWFLLTKNK